MRVTTPDGLIFYNFNYTPGSFLSAGGLRADRSCVKSSNVFHPGQLTQFEAKKHIKLYQRLIGIEPAI